MIFRTTLLAVFLITPQVFAAGSLSGSWELQSMGGDRDFTLEQKGKRLVAHRVMWPSFEGEKYKLEHLYRGKIKGDKIVGQLLVREEDVPKFEVLRNFVGRVEGGTKILLDGLPLKRMGKAKGEAPEVAPGKRAGDAPSFAKAKPDETTQPEKKVVLAQAAPPPAPLPSSQSSHSQSPKAKAAAPDAVVEAPPAGAGGLFAQIMAEPGMKEQGLFDLSMKVTIPKKTERLTARGDKLFAQRRYKDALAKFRAAAKFGKMVHPNLLHRMGRCHLKLHECGKAKSVLSRALRLDPGSIEIKKAYRAARESC